MKEIVFFRTMGELITNIKVIASSVIEWDNDIFEGVEFFLIF